MSATGIGASVRRKEDQRFITGKGHYTDDINRPGQAAIYFIRSPHAHAKIKKIDTAAAAKMPGVAGVFTGEAVRPRQARQSHLRLDGAVEGRLADEDGAARGARRRQGQSCRRRRRGRDRRYIGAGERRRRESRGRLRAALRRGRSDQSCAKRRAAHSRQRAQQHDLQLAHRRPGRDRRGVQERQARHKTRIHQQPAGAERHGAARGAGRIRFRQRPSDFVERDAESARGAPRHCRLRRHGA